MTAGDVDYAVHGHGYAQQRRADPRIARRILQALGDARTVFAFDGSLPSIARRR